MKEKTYLFIYCISGEDTVEINRNLSYSQITNPGWWLDCFISSYYRDLDDPTWDETVEKPVYNIVSTVKKELKTKSSVTISGNYGYLTICEANTVINLDTNIL